MKAHMLTKYYIILQVIINFNTEEKGYWLNRFKQVLNKLLVIFYDLNDYLKNK